MYCLKQSINSQMFGYNSHLHNTFFINLVWKWVIHRYLGSYWSCLNLYLLTKSNSLNQACRCTQRHTRSACKNTFIFRRNLYPYPPPAKVYPIKIVLKEGFLLYQSSSCYFASSQSLQLNNTVHFLTKQHRALVQVFNNQNVHPPKVRKKKNTSHTFQKQWCLL